MKRFSFNGPGFPGFTFLRLFFQCNKIMIFPKILHQQLGNHSEALDNIFADQYGPEPTIEAIQINT